MLFGCSSKCQDDVNLNLFINGQRINKVSNCKYLGVIIDDALNWEEHANFVYKKIIRFSSIIYKLRVIVPKCVLNKLYYAFINPHIVYGIEVYANASKVCLDKLIKANNKILRIFMNKKLDTPNIDLYHSFNVLPIPLLHEMNLLQIVYKFNHLKHWLPEVFQEYYITNRSVHDHLTRNKLNLHYTTVNSNFGKRCSVFRAGQYWNNLPNNFKLESSFSVFKKNIKHFLLHRS